MDKLRQKEKERKYVLIEVLKGFPLIWHGQSLQIVNSGWLGHIFPVISMTKSVSINLNSPFKPKQHTVSTPTNKVVQWSELYVNTQNLWQKLSGKKKLVELRKDNTDLQTIELAPRMTGFPLKKCKMFEGRTQVYFCPLHSNVRNTCCDEPSQITHTHKHTN